MASSNVFWEYYLVSNHKELKFVPKDIILNLQSSGKLFKNNIKDYFAFFILLPVIDPLLSIKNK